MTAEASRRGKDQFNELPDTKGDQLDNPAAAPSYPDDKSPPGATTTVPGMVEYDEVTHGTTEPSNLVISSQMRRQSRVDDSAKQSSDHKLSIRQKLKILNQIATVEDDGSMVVVPSTLEVTPSNVTGKNGNSDDDAEESSGGADIPYRPPLQIVMLIAGSQGDVELFIAIGVRLQDCGHRVRLATHANFKELTLSAGLEFFPLAGDPVKLTTFMMENRFRPSSRAISAFQGSQIKEFIFSVLPACKDPDPDTGIPFRADTVIANPPAYGHLDVAEALKLPVHIFSTMPWTPTSEFPHPLSVETQPNEYFVSYLNIFSMISHGQSSIINNWRKRILKLRPCRSISLKEYEEIPHAYIWSPQLVPKPLDWDPMVDVVGSVFFDFPDYRPPESLQKWLESGDKPIYINLQILELVNMTEIVVRALEMTGQRGIMCFGTLTEPKDFIYSLDSCPYGWLFSRCKAVVHHGGAGITAAGLKAACPTTIVRVFGDRSFWGDRVHAKLLGLAPIPVEELSLQKLVDAIEFMKNYEAPIRRDGYGDTGTAIRDTAFSENNNTAIRRVYM